ncbi:MAG: amidohydrolase family protein [Lachnospiraceae bacterium]|nr:amidohydrolase family protein [Lachnospiraceae bacterium]
MTTLIKNAMIIDPAEETVENASILFSEEGIIRKGIFEAEADRVIDGAGKTVLPGFIDCHVHPAALCAEDEMTVAFRAYRDTMDLLRSGITTLRSVGTKYNADVRLRDMIESGKIDGPRIKAAGQPICITCGHCEEIGMPCDTVGETLKAARTLCKNRVDWLKMMPTAGVLGVGPSTEIQLSKEQIEAVIAVGKAFATPTCAHLMNYEALEFCVEAGLTCVEHGYDMDERIAARMVELGTWYIPTATVTLNESTYIKPDNKHNAELVEKAAAAQVKVRNALKIAVKAGVKMGVGTDTGCPFTDPEHFAYASELYLYSISGMKPMDILKAATIRGAELLGIDGETGCLEAGRCADIVVLDGDPLKDIGNCRNVEYTFCRGKLLYRKDRPQY